MAHDTVPDEVGAVESHLRDRGYDLVSESRDEASFGDTQMTFERGRTLVRLVRDRGQWFLEATAATWDDWFAPTIWHALLTDSMPTLADAEFAVQGRLLLDDLDQIEAVTGDAAAGQLARLLDWRARRAEARRALPPDAS
jgi:hypothetical protein